MTGSEIEPRAKSVSAQIVERIRSPEFAEQVQMALPENVSVNRFVRATVTALMQNADLARADQQSIYMAAIRCAQDGLLPDGREAALVVFGEQHPVAVYMPMIAGLRRIAALYGWAIRTEVVYERDQFDYELGLNPSLSHKPPRPGDPRGAPIAAYAVAEHVDGRKQIEVLSAQDIAKIRQVSRAKNRGPWVDWEERMWEKSAGRRLAAKLAFGEKESARIERLFDAAALKPGKASAMLYGTDEKATQRQKKAVLEPVQANFGDDVDVDVTESDADQTALASTSVAGDQLGSVSGTSGIASTVVPSGHRKGSTLGEVHSLGQQGAKWLWYALVHQNEYDEGFVNALRTFVIESEPSIWEDYLTYTGLPTDDDDDPRTQQAPPSS